jgi:hypothetical protein
LSKYFMFARRSKFSQKRAGTNRVGFHECKAPSEQLDPAGLHPDCSGGIALAFAEIFFEGRSIELDRQA